MLPVPSPTRSPGTADAPPLADRSARAAAYRAKAMRELAAIRTTFVQNIPAHTSDPVGDEECCICGEAGGAPEPVPHDDYDECTVRVHRACLEAHVAGCAGKVQERNLKCPGCKQYLAGMTPLPKPRRCMHNLGDGEVCLGPHGHLGNHARPTQEEKDLYDSAEAAYKERTKARQARVAAAQAAAPPAPAEHDPDVAKLRAAYAETAAARGALQAAPTASSPKFLARVKRKNLWDLAMARRNDEFADLFRDDLSALHDTEACVVCLSRCGVLRRFHQDAACECLAHPECAALLREAAVAPQIACRHCDRRRAPGCAPCDAPSAASPSTPATAPPRKRRQHVCGTPLAPSGYCCLPKGHLGNCI